jgi:hypothetical protein
MSKSDFVVVAILRIMGCTALLAMPVVFFPHAWMDAIHAAVGLGELPDLPIVRYLTRSLSAFYAMFGAITLYISFDLQRYRSLIRLWAILLTIMGFLLLGIDLASGMPTEWTWSEGTFTVAIGLLVLYSLRREK